jgi:diguanylate cyclase (GGDEF)-like protein
MIIEKYIEKVCFKEFEEIKDLTIKTLLKYMKEFKRDCIYITQNGKPIYLFEEVNLIEIILNEELEKSIEYYILKYPKRLFTLNHNENLIDAYNFMRNNNLKKVAVVKNEKLIGEIDFKIISSKMVDILVKDPLTDVFNEIYFETLIKEYKDFNKPMGIIYIDIKNIGIIEGLYGEEKVNEILKEFAKILKNSIRDIDFVFRDDFRFKIILLNDLEVTRKVIKRIKERLDNLEVEGIRVAYSLAYSHVPELEDNILLALNDIETKLID